MLHRLKIGGFALAAVPIALLASCGGAGEDRNGKYVWITPRDVTMAPGASWTFDADTEESDDSVIWSSGRGYVDGKGRYVAPTMPGDDWVRAQSRRYPQLADIVAISVSD